MDPPSFTDLRFGFEITMYISQLLSHQFQSSANAVCRARWFARTDFFSEFDPMQLCVLGSAAGGGFPQ